MKWVLASLFFWLYGSFLIWLIVKGCADLKSMHRQHEEIVATIKKARIEREAWIG